MQSGRHPTVLQKLCQLPFQYFSDPRLVRVLFPSLIAACYNNCQNKSILEREMSCVLLATFIQVPPTRGLCSSRGDKGRGEPTASTLQHTPHLHKMSSVPAVKVLGREAHTPQHKAQVRFPALSPDSSFLLKQTVGGSQWSYHPPTHPGDLDGASSCQLPPIAGI